eukprot:1889997-Pyramimonas_sp.AAC.1
MDPLAGKGTGAPTGGGMLVAKGGPKGLTSKGALMAAHALGAPSSRATGRGKLPAAAPTAQMRPPAQAMPAGPVSYTHLRAHETGAYL